jgi:hypothetical protein
MAINRGARASSHPTPSHFMATPSLHTPTPTRPLPLHLPHKHTLAQGSFGRSSIVRPPVLSLFVRSFDRSSDRSWFVRPFVRSFVRSFVQIIFFLPLCYRNSDRSIVHRSLIVPIHRSSFVHRHYSPFIVRSYELFTITIHRYYSSLLFIDHPITPNFNYSSIMLSSRPKTSQTHIPVIRTPVTVIFIPVGNFPSSHPS